MIVVFLFLCMCRVVVGGVLFCGVLFRLFCLCVMIDVVWFVVFGVLRFVSVQSVSLLCVEFVVCWCGVCCCLVLCFVCVVVLLLVCSDLLCLCCVFLREL